MRRKWQIIIGIMLIAFFILIAVAAPMLAPNDPNATNLAMKNAEPSAEYPLGCDQMGRCEFRFDSVKEIRMTQGQRTVKIAPY